MRWSFFVCFFFFFFLSFFFLHFYYGVISNCIHCMRATSRHYLPSLRYPTVTAFIRIRWRRKGQPVNQLAKQDTLIHKPTFFYWKCGVLSICVPRRLNFFRKWVNIMAAFEEMKKGGKRWVMIMNHDIIRYKLMFRCNARRRIWGTQDVKRTLEGWIMLKC